MSQTFDLALYDDHPEFQTVARGGELMRCRGGQVIPKDGPIPRSRVRIPIIHAFDPKTGLNIKILFAPLKGRTDAWAWETREIGGTRFVKHGRADGPIAALLAAESSS